MNSAFSRSVVNLGIGFLALRLIASPVPQESQQTPCCFSHDGYQGVCVVMPGEGETCESILEYLNKPGTVGKTYCGGSRLRGNWTAVPCPRPRTESGVSSTRLQPR